MSSDEKESAVPADDGESAEPLAKWERASALLIGVTCGGAGGYTVFERSNQAGTVMLLVLAAIFLLIGVQGTPLIKFGSNSGSVELDLRRKRRVEEALERANEEASAEKAEGIVEGVKLVAPDLVPTSYNPYRQYEDAVAVVISRMGYEVTRDVFVKQLRVDLKITGDGCTIYAELKYYQRPVPVQIAHQVIGMAYSLSAPVLLVASSELAERARAFIDAGPVGFAQWRDEADNTPLRAAIEALLREVNS